MMDYRSVVSSTEAWLFEEDPPADDDDVTVSVLSHCMATAVRDLGLAAPPASVAVATNPSCHSPAPRRDDAGGPLSEKTYVCSLAVASVSRSSTATLSRLDEPLPPPDRRVPHGRTAPDPGEPFFSGNEVLVGLSCGIRRRRTSTCSGEASASEPRFFCITDDVGGLDDDAQRGSDDDNDWNLDNVV